MRAYRLDDFDSLDSLRLHQEPDPRPQRGEVLVQVRAVSLNFRDIAILRGRYPRRSVPGLVPVSDAAGEVVAVGEDVHAFKVGDRVLGAFHPRWFGGQVPSTILRDSYGAENDGWLCELKAVSQEAVVPLPDALSFEEGATLPCAGVTAWNALSGATPVRAGHTVLVQGSGGVSIFALQLACAVGARVIATTSSEAKARTLRALGAAEVVNYADDPDWGRSVRALTGGGAASTGWWRSAGPAPSASPSGPWPSVAKSPPSGSSARTIPGSTSSSSRPAGRSCGTSPSGTGRCWKTLSGPSWPPG